ncbi:MAG: SDR family oxidoreductase [Parvibaculum sp.]
MTVNRLFCFGFGDTAASLARNLPRDAWDIAGTCRMPQKKAQMGAMNVTAHLFAGESDVPSETLNGVTHILISIPPAADGDVVIKHASSAIEANADLISWIGYLSTTGVYGNKDGELVTEDDPVSPSSERGKRRAQAEADWLALGRRTGIPVQIFRLPGIYGPGRNQIATLRAGKARRIVKPGHVFSRIHLDDIAQVLAASIARPRAGGIYNVCDDEAAPPQDVVAFAAELAGLPMPPEITLDEADLSPMGRSFYDETKRLSNERIKQELGVRLLYPTYREGLRALFARGE